MKIQIKAEIEGNFLLSKTVSVKLYPYDFAIFVDKGKRYICITKPIANYKDVAPKFYLKDGVPNLETTKPEAYKDMKQWLYYIEVMGAFNFEVKKIHIDELEVKWIYETEEEKGSIPITSLGRNRVRETPVKNISNSNLSNLVVFRKRLPDAYIPFDYYRQARNFFNENDYYFAYINYFMMLEFLFANGHSRKAAMIHDFMNSDLLQLCILKALQILKTNNPNKKNKDYLWLVQECQNRKKNLDFKGIVYVLVEFRGLLSHASIRSKKYLLDPEQLRSIALFISLICFILCGYIQIFCCLKEEDKRNRIKQEINELMKK